ncbi:MAG: hypothetical protein WC702_01260 [Patescibacteria group bacterium]|jgi:hypothetical protein
MNKKLIINIFGWVGVALVLGGYGLVSFDRLAVHDLSYQLMNGFGALCLIIESAWRKDYPFTVLNVVWAAIAIFAILSFVF